MTGARRVHPGTLGVVAAFGILTAPASRPKGMLDLAKAREELTTKSILDIERATAITWASRAAACLDLAHEAETRQGRQVRLTEAENYRQEAIEHAAMTEDIPFLQAILSEIDAHKTRREQAHPLPGKARGERPLAGGRGGPGATGRAHAGASPLGRH